MAKKSLKQRLLEKLHKEHGISIDPMKMHSFRRRGFGSRVISWSTIGLEQDYQSFETMANCLKYPTKLVRGSFGRDREITIEIDLEQLPIKRTVGMAKSSRKKVLGHPNFYEQDGWIKSKSRSD